MKISRIVLSIIVIFLCSSSFCHAVTDDNHKRLIQLSKKKYILIKTLKNLLKSKSDYSFVIFEEERSGKFVQFVSPLFLDLPFEPLTKEEIQKAENLFSDYGVKPENQIINMDLGGDVKLAARIVLRVFMEVYQFQEGFKLKIEKNGFD